MRRGGAADLIDSVGERRAAPRGGAMDTLDLDSSSVHRAHGGKVLFSYVYIYIE